MNAENPVQIDLFGVSATGTKDTRLAEHIGMSDSSEGDDLAWRDGGSRCAVWPAPGNGSGLSSWNARREAADC
jgi:hypothetical protein